MPNPQIQSIQSGCFLRGEQPFNVLLRVGPISTAYRVIATDVASQRVAYDQVLGLISAGGEAPIRLPNAGTFRIAVRYAPPAANQTPATAPNDVTVNPVTVATVNGQKVCRSSLPATPGARPTGR